MKTRPIIYALAFACEPGRGSEPGAGYAFAEALARLSNEVEYDISLLTRPHTMGAVRASIEAAVGENQLNYVPISIPQWLITITKRERVRFAYVAWQLKAVRHLSAEISRNNRVAVVHHVSFATEAIPTFEWQLGRRAVRLFGPAGSSQELNQSEHHGFRGLLRKRTRELFGRLNLSGTDLAIAQNSAVACTFRRLGANAVEIEPNVVIDREQIVKALQSTQIQDEPRIDLISVGLLVELKRQHLAISALAGIPDDSLTLTIVGDGPLRRTLMNHANDLGVADRVTFTGMLPRDEVLQMMSRARVLVHTSRQEGSAWVVGEAQSVGTVPVAFQGSGADSLISLAGLGVIAQNDTLESLIAAVKKALVTEAHPTDRWEAKRLPKMLGAWYGQALNSASK